MLAAAAFYLCGCGGDSGGGACGISGCGGDIKGTWDLTGMCAKLSGKTTSTGVAACDAVAQHALDTAKVVPMSMQVVFMDDTYSMSGNLEVAFDYVYTSACLTAQGGPGASEATCSDVQTALMNIGQPSTCSVSGDTCVCSATESMPVSETGPYRVDGTKLVMGTEMQSEPFCVQGDTARISAAASGISGSMTLKRH
jgi:hypothetical protein